jgi:hypothetical protein
MCISGVVCLTGEGQMCTVKSDLLSPRILNTGLMLMFMKATDSKSMTFMKFLHMFCNLSSMRLSEFHSDIEKFVPEGSQECTEVTQKQNSMDAAVLFLELYHRYGYEFLDHITTGEETWVSHNEPEKRGCLRSSIMPTL